MRVLTHNIKYGILATLLASGVGMALHVFLLQTVTPLITHAMQGISIPQPPYSAIINLFAFITALLPVSGLAFLYYWIGDYIPAQSRLGKGLLLGFSFLFLKGDLIRQPLMNLLVGNPWEVVLLQLAEVWIPDLTIAIIIALIIPSRKEQAVQSQVP